MVYAAEFMFVDYITIGVENAIKHWELAKYHQSDSWLARIDIRTVFLVVRPTSRKDVLFDPPPGP
jgi:pyruvate/2-oxoglutarate/acetoin dehydrogenase E1 component